jgi:phosphoribosyl-ATP pyrophosphohydrolase
MTAPNPEKIDTYPIFGRLTQVIEGRKGQDPGQSYVASLLAKGPLKARNKVVEEAAEVFEAAGVPGEEGKAALVGESADLLFHLMVLLASRGSDLEAVARELERREGVGGHDEKAGRKPSSSIG